MAQPYAYFNYPFTVTLQGNQLVFTFSGMPSRPLAVPVVHYVNANQLTVQVNRLNNNLAEIGDKKGVITVSWILATVSGYTITNMATFIQAITSLAASSTNPPVHNMFLATKSIAQTYPSGVVSNVTFNNVQNSTTDLTYTIPTGLFTVNVTGDYEVDLNAVYQTTTASMPTGIRSPTNATSLVKYSVNSNNSPGSVSVVKFSCNYPFNAGDTFSIGVLAGAVVAAYVAEPNTFYLSIKRVPAV